MDLDGSSDVVEHAAQHVVVRVAYAHPGVGHVAGLDRLGGRARRRKVGVDDPLAVAMLDLVDAGVAGDVSVAVRAQSDDARRVPPRRCWRRVPWTIALAHSR